MSRTLTILGRSLPLGTLLLAFPAFAAAVEGQLDKQATNWAAIGMFFVFVVGTLGITYWAARRTTSRAQFYTAGGGITGFQNGLAIAGDYMSAASFLGISALVYSSGYDGLIYSIGFLVGWPLIMFLMAERLRNLGRFTFADVVSYRLSQTPIRVLSAAGTLTVVAFYLIAQMVGAGQLIKLLFGLDYMYAVIIVGILMMVYVMFGGMLATTWVQIIKAGLLLGGASFIALMVLIAFGFNVEALFAKAVEVSPKHGAIMRPGALVSDPVSAISLGLALMFGTAGLPHILMRFFTVADAKEARKSVLWATSFIGYFYLLTFIIGFGAIVLVSTNPAYVDAKGALIGGSNMAAIHLANAVGGSLLLGFISAVAFATILAVVAGLTLAGATAVSHDLYASVFRKGRADERRELAGVEDGDAGARHHRHRARHPVREAEHRLHGRPGVRDRGERQLSATVPVDVLARADHARRGGRQHARAGHGGGADRAQPGDLGEGAGLSGADLPVRCAGAVLDAARVLRVLAGLGARPQQGGARRGEAVRCPVCPLADRHRHGGGGEALDPTRPSGAG